MFTKTWGMAIYKEQGYVQMAITQELYVWLAWNLVCPICKYISNDDKVILKAWPPSAIQIVQLWFL